MLEALEKTRPYLRSHGGNVELVARDADGDRAAPHAGQLPRLPFVGGDAQARHREGDLEAAPDVTAIVVERTTTGPAKRGRCPLVELGRVDRRPRRRPGPPEP